MSSLPVICSSIFAGGVEATTGCRTRDKPARKVMVECPFPARSTGNPQSFSQAFSGGWIAGMAGIPRIFAGSFKVGPVYA